jgi:hypothetical protein
MSTNAANKPAMEGTHAAEQTINTKIKYLLEVPWKYFSVTTHASCSRRGGWRSVSFDEWRTMAYRYIFGSSTAARVPRILSTAHAPVFLNARALCCFFVLLEKLGDDCGALYPLCSGLTEQVRRVDGR